MRLEQASRGDYQVLIALWEASVRATHHFLPEKEIATLRELILEHYFDAVALTCARSEQGIAGFCGVHEGNIEMLFIDPALRGGGGGSPAGGRCHRPAGGDPGGRQRAK